MKYIYSTARAIIGLGHPWLNENYVKIGTCKSSLDFPEDLDEVGEAEDESAVGADVQHRVAHPLVRGVREVDDAQIHDVLLDLVSS